MKRSLLVAAKILLSAAGVHAQTAPAPSAATSDSQAQTEDLKLRPEAHERLTVPVRLSGTGPYYFLVDTGADRTAVSRDLATLLKLERGTSAQLHSVAGVSTVSTVKVPQLQLTRMPVTIQEAPLLDARNMGADGILGVDSLGSHRVVFDFVGETMAIVPSSIAERRDEPGAIVIQARRRNGRLIISQAKAEDRPVTIVLDTGAQVSIGNAALRKKLRIGEGRTAEGQVELESVTGAKLRGDVVRLKKVVVGGVTLSDLVVVFADAHTFQQLGLQNKPALLLGMNAMRAFKKVSIDFANRKFRVVVPEQSQRDVELARLPAVSRLGGR